MREWLSALLIVGKFCVAIMAIGLLIWFAASPACTAKFATPIAESKPLPLMRSSIEVWLKKEAPTVSWKTLIPGGVLFINTEESPTAVIASQVFNLKVGWPAGVLLENDIEIQTLQGGPNVDKNHDSRCVTTRTLSDNNGWMCTGVSIMWTSYTTIIFPDAARWFTTKPPS